ncbi:CheR family methyltransferase [Massilia sp. TN1-12]|uniref:CheR family methyltransferase n=1 Tax=Massilia paldalensis TaxID=3377675 RepID=UPI00384BF3D4
MSLLRTIEEATGLVLTEADLARALRELFPHDAAARAAHAPAPGTPAFDALLDLLVVPESWMYRDPAVFEEALRFVRARLAARPDARLRILSLPCAGGEEPYSMAMSLMRAGVDPRRCRIDAFDLSHAAIARARSGRYTRNAFRGTDLAFRERHFTHADGQWTVNADVRAYVRFAQANLFDLDAASIDAAALAGRYDVVFCRNLLIYFDEDATRRAAAVLSALLADDGLLLSGYAEAPALCRNGFTSQGSRQVFALRKEGNAPAAAPAPAARPPARPAPPAPLPTAPAAAPVRARATPQDQLAQARRHADAGRMAEAETLCRGLLARQPDLADAWFLLGAIDEAAGRTRAAERCWRRCTYLDPQHYEALCSLALLHEQLGDAVRGASFRRRAAQAYERRGGPA